MSKCTKCESLNSDEPVYIVVYKSKSPFSEDLGYWVDGFRCYETGETALTIEELEKKANCNKIIN